MLYVHGINQYSLKSFITFASIIFLSFYPVFILFYFIYFI